MAPFDTRKHAKQGGRRTQTGRPCDALAPSRRKSHRYFSSASEVAACRQREYPRLDVRIGRNVLATSVASVSSRPVAPTTTVGAVVCGEREESCWGNRSGFFLIHCVLLLAVTGAGWGNRSGFFLIHSRSMPDSGSSCWGNRSGFFLIHFPNRAPHVHNGWGNRSGFFLIHLLDEGALQVVGWGNRSGFFLIHSDERVLEHLPVGVTGRASF